jgi:predicted P-loop ATPase
MISTSLNKDKILQHTTMQDICLKFLGLSESPRNNISSPFSDDKKPSFKLYANGTFKCNSSGKQGDYLQLVADLNGLNCKTQMPEVLSIIATEMNLLHNFQNVVKSDSAIVQKKDAKPQTEVAPKQLSIATRDFTTLDIDYWNKLSVSEEILKRYGCNSISSYSWTGKSATNTKNTAIAFAWQLDNQYKLYIPNQPDVDVKKNVLPAFKSGIFGLSQIGAEKKESIILCEGEKDVVVAISRGFNAVTFGSATIYPKKEQIAILQAKCKQIFVCYDIDEQGEIGTNTILKNNATIIPLYLPNPDKVKGFDITDYFQSHSAQDFQKIIDLAVKNKSVNDTTPEEELTTIIHITENYLNKNYEIRHNIISNEIEISKIDSKDWSELNENTLWIEMQKKSIKVPSSTLEKILRSDFVPKFNPFIDYFNALPIWDKTVDYITQYADYIKLSPDEDKEQYNYHFKKWCVRSVKCATIDNYFNKNAFVISDEGKGQNIGKTTWIRNLCPKTLSNYIKDDLPKDEKDAKISLTQNFIVNLDELASLSRQEINTLKSLFSADKIKVRFPYDKKDSVVRRVANFIGSTNLSTFLHDETGSVRWLCFVADTIDFSYKNNFDMDKLWSQAFALSKDENFDETITSVDMSINEMRNAKFQIQSPEKDLICRYLEIPKTVEETKILTSTEIQHYLAGFANTIKLNNVTIGKALTSLKFRKIRSSVTTKYAVKYKENVD